MERLTDSQQALVENNHNLIYSFAIKNNLVLDDCYDILAIGLCKAAKVFDEKKCSFSTLAYKCMKNELGGCFKECHKKSFVPENMVLSYDKTYISDNGKANTIIDYIEDNFSIQDYVINHMMMQEFIGKLKGIEKEIIGMKMIGITEKEIAHQMGMSKQYINMVVHKIRNKYRSMCC